MSRTTAWILHSAVLVMGATGAWLTWIAFLAPAPVETELAMYAVQDPWQPWLVAVHVVVGPLLIFYCGLIWFTHVWGRIRLGYDDRRAGGLFLTYTLLPLVLCGYLLQILEGEGSRLVAGWIHAGAGLLFTAVYAAHVWRSGVEPADED